MIKLGDELKRRLVDALTDGVAVVASYIDPNGDPHISFYGSVHAYSDQELGLWARNPESALVAGIPDNPKVAFAYADLSTRTFYRLHGTARVTTDEAERERVFAGMHPFEQGQDPERSGTAIIVALDEVAGRDESGMFSMTHE